MDSIVPWQPQPNNIYHMDALALLRHMPDNSVDLIVTDPPYGIGRDKGMGGGGKRLAKSKVRKYIGDWDYKPNSFVFQELLRLGNTILIFGGNYFADMLPSSTYWIVWDKLNTMPSYGDCELIWTNLPNKRVDKITYQLNGFINGIRDRVHPTQKPVPLIEQLIATYSKPNALILDPFMGSGTTAVAAQRLGRQYIGCDISAEYVEIARRRVQNADPYQQTTLDNGLVQKSLFAEVMHE